MFDEIALNEGMMVENVVAQMLASNDIELFFYARYDKQNAENRMEIDFLLPSGDISRKNNVIAVEVKSEDGYTLLSLEKFCRKFRGNVGKSYVLHPGDIREENDRLRLPLYMAQWLG